MFELPLCELPSDRTREIRAACPHLLLDLVRAATYDEFARVENRKPQRAEWRRTARADHWDLNCALYDLRVPWPECAVSLVTLRDAAVYAGRIKGTPATAGDIDAILRAVTPDVHATITTLPSRTFEAVRHAARVVLAPVRQQLRALTTADLHAYCEEWRRDHGFDSGEGAPWQILSAMQAPTISAAERTQWLQARLRRAELPLSRARIERVLARAPGGALAEPALAAQLGVTLRKLRDVLHRDRFSRRAGYVRSPDAFGKLIAPELFVTSARFTRHARHVRYWCTLVGGDVDFQASVEAGWLQRTRRDVYRATPKLGLAVWVARSRRYRNRTSPPVPSECYRQTPSDQWHATFQTLLAPYLAPEIVHELIARSAELPDLNAPTIYAFARKTLAPYAPEFPQ